MERPERKEDEPEEGAEMHSADRECGLPSDGSDDMTELELHAKSVPTSAGQSTAPTPQGTRAGLGHF